MLHVRSGECKDEIKIFHNTNIYVERNIKREENRKAKDSKAI